MISRLISTAFVFISIIVFATSANAQIYVVSVKGTVAYKSGRVWQPLTKVSKLAPGVKISTGPRSSATIMLDKHRVIIRQLSMIKIYEHSVSKLQEQTRIGLRRGTIRAKVNKSTRIKTVFRVSTPVATSSVRGTEKIISFGPAHGMVISMIEGTAEGESKNGTKRVISGRYVFNQKLENKDPQPLLYRLEMQASVPLYNDGSTTSEERRGDRYTQNDVVGSRSGSTASFERIVDDNKVTVNIIIQFNP